MDAFIPVSHGKCSFTLISYHFTIMANCFFYESLYHPPLWFLQVQLSFHSSEGDYQVLVSVNSLVLLESRCAECYDAGGGEVQRNSCCDENNTNSCPDSCDIILRFCQLGDLSQFNLADGLFGIECPGTPLSSHFDDFLGYNLKANETYSDKESLQGGVVFNSHVVYDGAGRWVN